MKERLQGLLVGVLIGAMCFGGFALATNAAKTISVTYSNIKVYKDNVLCELKDANGTTVEPFIYNGTTYMPVRGTANLADMQVTWDGQTKSVYLWDEMVPEGTSFIEVCPPYSTDDFRQYTDQEGESFSMAGKKYSNGIVSGYTAEALFNLDSRFSTLECVIGHTKSDSMEKSVSFLVDGKVVKTVELESECLPKTVQIPLKYGLQLKIVTEKSGVGIGNMTVK